MNTVISRPIDNKEILADILPFWDKLNIEQRSLLIENTSFAKYSKKSNIVYIIK